jgi:hypothetical protein
MPSTRMIDGSNTVNVTTTMFSSAASGAVSKAIVHPLDTAKILLMVQRDEHFTFSTASKYLRAIFAQEGGALKTLYRGYLFCTLLFTLYLII